MLLRMNSSRWIRAALGLAATLFTSALGAQVTPNAVPAASTRAPRVAVVLSGGGAKGIAHIGVLQVLEEEGISPQIVTGTSMGALVGGLYAMGYSPSALDSMVRSFDWPSYFSDASDYELLGLDRRRTGERTLLSVPMRNWRPTLPSGAIVGQRISRLLSALTWPAQTTRDFHTLPRDFVAVATDIESGEAVVLDHGSLAKVMRASMSLPSIFEPVPLNGRLLIDGGIVRNLPAADARARGADIVICSDVADPLLRADELGSLTDVLMQTISFQMEASSASQRKLCDLYIQPDITGLTATDFSNAGKIVARGSAAANALRARIRALAVPRSAIDIARHAPWSDSVRVAQITVEGVAGRAALRVRRALALHAGGWYTAAAIDTAIERAYATDLYDRVQYQLDATGTDTTLVVSATPREVDRAGFGFRFDDTYKAALLFSVLLRNRLGTGSATTLEMRLGEQLKLGVEHFSTSVENPRFVFGAGASGIHAPLDIYQNGQRALQVTLSVASVHAFTGAKFGQHGGVGLEVMGEASKAATAIAVTDSSARNAFGSVSALFVWEALDRPIYPHRGSSVFARSEYAAGSTRFTQHLVRGRYVQPLAPTVSLLTDAMVGTSTRGNALPPHRSFKLGGSYPSVLFPERTLPFYGLRPSEEFGTSVVRAGVDVQWEVRRQLFATMHSNIGYAGNVLTLDQQRYHTGFGLSVGSITPLGQVELTASGQNRRGGTRLELNIGRMF